MSNIPTINQENLNSCCTEVYPLTANGCNNYDISKNYLFLIIVDEQFKRYLVIHDLRKGVETIEAKYILDERPSSMKACDDKVYLICGKKLMSYSVTGSRLIAELGDELIHSIVFVHQSGKVTVSSGNSFVDCSPREWKIYHEGEEPLSLKLSFKVVKAHGLIKMNNSAIISLIGFSVARVFPKDDKLDVFEFAKESLNPNDSSISLNRITDCGDSHFVFNSQNGFISKKILVSASSLINDRVWKPTLILEYSTCIVTYIDDEVVYFSIVVDEKLVLYKCKLADLRFDQLSVEGLSL